MLLTITTAHRPATDLGYLLYKNPARPQAFDLSFGQAHVFYPEASPDRCTAALLLEVDPVGLVRNRRGPAVAPAGTTATVVEISRAGAVIGRYDCRTGWRRRVACWSPQPFFAPPLPPAPTPPIPAPTIHNQEVPP